MSNVYTGSCLCGGVQFSVKNFSAQAANCHCTMCRKFHGAAYGTLVSVGGLEWLLGKDLLKEFVAENGTTRTFCMTCGSSLGFRVKGEPIEQIELAISTFNCDIPVTVNAQIYTDDKANWCKLNSEIPIFSKGRIA